MRLLLIKLLLKGLNLTVDDSRKLRETTNFTLMTNGQADLDFKHCNDQAYTKGRLDGYKNGQEFGRYEVLRYTKNFNGWDSVAEHFKYDELLIKFPEERVP